MIDLAQSPARNSDLLPLKIPWLTWPSCLSSRVLQQGCREPFFPSPWGGTKDWPERWRLTIAAALLSPFLPCLYIFPTLPPPIPTRLGCYLRCYCRCYCHPALQGAACGCLLAPEGSGWRWRWRAVVATLPAACAGLPLLKAPFVRRRHRLLWTCPTTTSAPLACFALHKMRPSNKPPKISLWSLDHFENHCPRTEDNLHEVTRCEKWLYFSPMSN